MMCRYKDYVDNDNIKGVYRENYRYILRIPYKKSSQQNKNVLVIMKNPSEANNEISDHSINNVLTYCHTEYETVYIMNLFPCYSTKASNVKKFINSSDYKKTMARNIRIIKFFATKLNDVIVAWGGNTIGAKKEYTTVIENTLSAMADKQPVAIRLKDNSKRRNYPWHPQVWATKHSLEKYIWKK